jgi:hypothetical protein
LILIDYKNMKIDERSSENRFQTTSLP